MNKKIIFTIGILFMATGTIFAQKNVRTSAIMAYDSGQGDLQKAKKYIDEASAHETTKNDPKTLYYKGLIYIALHQKGENLEGDELNKAIKALKVAKVADNAGKKKFKTDIVKALNIARVESFNGGIANYNAKKYADAAKGFKNSIIASELMGSVDTTAYFNYALSSELSENDADAITYYKKSAEIGYGEEVPYVSLARLYKKAGDNEMYIKTVKDGIAKFTQNQALIVQMINYYLDEKKMDEAYSYLSKAVELDPSNATLVSNRATVLDAMGRKDEAIKEYEKAIKLDSNLFDAPFNLGVLHYNSAVEEHDKLPEKMTDAVYNKEKARIDKIFAQALPYLERAYEIKPEDAAVKVSLSRLYARLNMTEKYNTLKNK